MDLDNNNKWILQYEIELSFDIKYQFSFWPTYFSQKLNVKVWI
jgi:hypothetical protein